MHPTTHGRQMMVTLSTAKQMKFTVSLFVVVALLSGCTDSIDQPTPRKSIPVSQILPKLAAPDMQSKLQYHYDLINRGIQIVPELEAAIPDADKNTRHSIMRVLSQIGRENPDLVPRFLDLVTVDQDPVIAGLYLDVVQDIVQPEGSRESYYFSATQGNLDADAIVKMRSFWSNAYRKKVDTDNKRMKADH